MARLRNFSPEVLQVMADNIDDNTGDLWDFFQDAGAWFEGIFTNARQIQEDLDELNKYLNRYLELEDITHRELLQILDAVKEVEDRYCRKFKDSTEELRDIRLQLKGFQMEMGDVVQRANTLRALYGEDADILDNPEKLAHARYDATKRGLALPLTAAQLALSEAAYQRLIFMDDAPALCVEALQDARAKGATQLTELTGVADISQLMIDVENYNRRNPNSKIAAPTLTQGQGIIINAYRKEVQMGQDPLMGKTILERVSGFPYYRDGSTHGGVDFPASTGTPITSTFYGTVESVVAVYSSSSNNQGSTGTASYGNYVQVKVLGAGPNDEDVYVTYAHMSTVDVELGDTIVPGCSIGAVGNTGNSYGAHLHFDVRYPESSGATSWPYDYLDDRFIPHYIQEGIDSGKIDPNNYR